MLVNLESTGVFLDDENEAASGEKNSPYRRQRPRGHQLKFYRKSQARLEIVRRSFRESGDGTKPKWFLCEGAAHLQLLVRDSDCRSLMSQLANAFAAESEGASDTWQAMRCLPPAVKNAQSRIVNL